ncbi:class I adenylate-forming enzyme family protein [Niveispirillum fermenti]|uniref:class I adenylate-forming enzyme family protein n=1 Tax=Niveispirillum fermenti TaxID=1233113 RepID=UPI003A886249
MTASGEPIEAAPVLSRISDYVGAHATRFPDREAVVAGARRLTYADLEALVTRCARALVAAGVEKGDRVALLGNATPEYLVVFLATASIGGIWMGLSPRYKIDEYRYLLGDARPSVVFSIREFEGRDYRADLDRLAGEFGCVRTWVDLDADGGFDDFLASGDGVPDAALTARRDAVGRFDPALVVYTSGSSGKPKGALLSHHGLCFGNAIQGRAFGVDVPRAVCPFPINHVACVGDTCCTTLIRGGTLVLLPRFDAGTVLDTIEAERINLWIGVPTMFILAADRPDFDARDLSSLRSVVWGGAAMPRDYIARYRRLGVRLVTLYGLTETTTDTTFTGPDASNDELAETVGRPCPEYPCRIVDEDGNTVPPGEQGEIQFKGDYVMLGYFNRPEATRDAFTPDGWLRSGDIGWFRPDGNLVFVSRKSEMFKSGGFNVYPREIEDVIEAHPDVALAGVIGVPDPLFREVGEAHVLRRPGSALTADEIAAWCRERLANYKVPKRFHVRDSLPMLPVGKIDKPALKREAANG